MHAFLDHSGPIPIVHRGAPLDHDGRLVENTLAAFERAYQRGFRYFETDVHATRDGVLVACHDRTLRRVAGERARIAALNWSEISRVLVADEPLPLLEDLLAAFPDVRFNIDPKSDAAVRPLVDALRSATTLDRVCVASFSDRRLRWVRAALGPRVCTAAGPRELRTATYQTARSQPVLLPGVNVLQIPRFLTRPTRTRWRGPRTDLLEAAQRVGIPVHVWTVNDEAEMDGLLARGVDGLMSDELGSLARSFARHGWKPDQDPTHTG